MSAATWRRWLPLAGLLGLGLAVYASGLHRALSLEALQRERAVLQELVAACPVLAPLAFILTYAAAAVLCLPGAALLTVAGGFLFGILPGSLWSVIGATTGAIGLFLIARSTLGAALRERAGPWLGRLEGGFRRDAFSYLLALRLVPLFPFWLINLVPALLQVPLTTFAVATLVGVIPGSLVYASIGGGLDAVLARGGQPDLGLVLEPRILLPMLGLSILALLPALYRRWRQP